MPNFSDILNKPSAEVEPPKPLPPGTYLCVVDGQPEITKKGKNQTDVVVFKLKPMQAQPDVDQNALQEMLKGSALADKRITHNVWATEDSIWRLKQFLVDHLGIEEGSKTLGQMIPEAMGRQLLVTMSQRPSEDGQQMFPEVKGTAKV